MALTPEQELEIQKHLAEQQQKPGIIDHIRQYVMKHNGLGATDQRDFEQANSADQAPPPAQPAQHFADGGTVLPAPTFTPASFDVDAQSPNLDSTYKMAGQVPNAPAPVQDMTPKPMPPPVPVAVQAPAATKDTAVDDDSDDETKKKNPKVESSHPGFSQDELEKYLMNERGQMDKYGPDAQAKSLADLRAQQGSLRNRGAQAGSDFADALMMAGGHGNPGFGAGNREQDQRAVDNQMAMGKSLNEANQTAIKAKESLDHQSSENPLGASVADTMLPMLKQVYPGKTDAEYAQMARNPAVAEALLPEGVKLAEGDKKIQAAHEERMAQREYLNSNREELRQDRLERQAQTGLASIRGDASLKNVETQRDAAIQAYNRISAIEKSGKGMNPIDYVDVLGQIYKARTGTAPTEVILNSAKQATLQGNFGKAYTFLTGQQAPATTPAIMASLKDMTLHMGQQADQLHEGYMRSHGASAFPAGLNAEAKERLGAQGRGLSFAEATRDTSGTPPEVTSQEAYNALPSGASYMANGILHRKK